MSAFEILLISRLAIDDTWCWRLQKQLSQIKTQRMPGIESQKNFGKEVNGAEEKFKQDSAAYLQRLINEREKTKPKLTNP
jgi:hypothetical protein